MGTPPLTDRISERISFLPHYYLDLGKIVARERKTQCRKRRKDKRDTLPGIFPSAPRKDEDREEKAPGSV